MKLYTKTGDDGTTGLFGGPRVAKDDLRITAYGTVDELNACVGLAAAALPPEGTPFTTRLAEILPHLQSRLFDLGADLATPADSPHADKVTRFQDAWVADAESWIDEIDAENEPMKTFVLPGGTELAARLHIARTVCRRAERAMITLAHRDPITAAGLIYVNRLSDLFFAMSRAANRDAGVPDVPWIPAGTEE